MFPITLVSGPQTGRSEALASVLDPISRGWTIAVSDSHIEGRVLKGEFSLRTQGPLLTGKAEVTVADGKITGAYFTLDQESLGKLRDPRLYVRKEPSFRAREVTEARSINTASIGDGGAC
jgi:hypothetical protein